MKYHFEQELFSFTRAQRDLTLILYKYHYYMQPPLLGQICVGQSVGVVPGKLPELFFIFGVTNGQLEPP